MQYIYILFDLASNPWTFSDPNDLKRQEAIAKLWPIGAPALAGLFTGVGFGQGRPQSSAAAAQDQSKEGNEEKDKKDEEKEEVFFSFYSCFLLNFY